MEVMSHLLWPLQMPVLKLYLLLLFTVCPGCLFANTVAGKPAAAAPAAWYL